MIYTKIFKIKDISQINRLIGEFIKTDVAILNANIYLAKKNSNFTADTEKISGALSNLNINNICIISQPFLEDYIAAIEIYYVDIKDAEILSDSNSNFIHFRFNQNELLFISVNSDSTVKYEDAFAEQHRILKEHNFTFNDVFRQWNFIPDICSLKNDDTEYSKFNTARKKYYSMDNLQNYPAATGIGIDKNKAIINTIAIKGEYEKYFLENTLQTSAFQYSDEVISTSAKDDPSKPLFSRALILKTDTDTQLFLSGTAAIRGEQSVNSNLNEQLHITIENINNLVKPENITNATKLSFENISPNYLKIYLKNDDKVALIGKKIHQEYGIDNFLIVQADICRSELLIEIEGVFILK